MINHIFFPFYKKTTKCCLFQQMRELICPWKSAAWTLIFWHLIFGEWGADKHGKQCGTFPSIVRGEGNCTEAAGGVCRRAERQRCEVMGKDDSRGGHGWPGRWRVSSCRGSFKEAGSVFLPQDCSALWNITAALQGCLGHSPGHHCYCHLPSNSQGSGVHARGCHCMLLLLRRIIHEGIPSVRGGDGRNSKSFPAVIFTKIFPKLPMSV